MSDQDWQGGKRDPRLYRHGRAEKQQRVREKYERLRPFPDERGRRLWAANEAIAFGHGGIRGVAEALRMSQQTLIAGRRELLGEARGAARGPVAPGRQRRRGGGRKPLAAQHPGLVQAIEAIVDPATRGDPMAPLKWTSKSLKHISAALTQAGQPASPTTVSKILRDQLKYSLQGLKKTKEGAAHPDRDAQFQYLSRQCQTFQARAQPVVSVDAKKKELVGDFRNGGRPGSPNRCARTTSRTRTWARAFPTASLTRAATRAGSASG